MQKPKYKSVAYRFRSVSVFMTIFLQYSTVYRYHIHSTNYVGSCAECTRHAMTYFYDRYCGFWYTFPSFQHEGPKSAECRLIFIVCFSNTRKNTFILFQLEFHFSIRNKYINWSPAANANSGNNAEMQMSHAGGYAKNIRPPILSHRRISPLAAQI